MLETLINLDEWIEFFNTILTFDQDDMNELDMWIDANGDGQITITDEYEDEILLAMYSHKGRKLSINPKWMQFLEIFKEDHMVKIYNQLKEVK